MTAPDARAIIDFRLLLSKDFQAILQEQHRLKTFLAEQPSPIGSSGKAILINEILDEAKCPRLIGLASCDGLPDRFLEVMESAEAAAELLPLKERNQQFIRAAWEAHETFAKEAAEIVDQLLAGDRSAEPSSEVMLFHGQAVATDLGRLARRLEKEAKRAEKESATVPAGSCGDGETKQEETKTRKHRGRVPEDGRTPQERNEEARQYIFKHQPKNQNKITAKEIAEHIGCNEKTANRLPAFKTLTSEWKRYYGNARTRTDSIDIFDNCLRRTLKQVNEKEADDFVRAYGETREVQPDKQASINELIRSQNEDMANDEAMGKSGVVVEV